MCVCVCVCVEGAAWGRNISSQWKADCARCFLFFFSVFSFFWRDLLLFVLLLFFQLPSCLPLAHSAP